MTNYTPASSLMALGGVALGTLVVVGYLVFIWWLDRTIPEGVTFDPTWPAPTAH